MSGDAAAGGERPLPDGLERCSVCGEARGMPHGPYPTVVCRCSNVRCRSCGRLTLRRPVHDYYDEAAGRFVHVPWFGGMMPCAECRHGQREAHA